MSRSRSRSRSGSNVNIPGTPQDSSPQYASACDELPRNDTYPDDTMLQPTVPLSEPAGESLAELGYTQSDDELSPVLVRSRSTFSGGSTGRLAMRDPAFSEAVHHTSSPCL